MDTLKHLSLFVLATSCTVIHMYHYHTLSDIIINIHVLAVSSVCVVYTVGARFISVTSYQASRDDELSFVRGAIVQVLKKYIDGWWLVRYSHALM